MMSKFQTLMNEEESEDLKTLLDQNLNPYLSANGHSNGKEKEAVKATPGKSTGFVKFFDNEKGYGFIENDDGSGDIFVHQSQIYSKGFRSLAEDERVEFDAEQQDDGKWRALNVTGPGGAHCVGK